MIMELVQEPALSIPYTFSESTRGTDEVTLCSVTGLGSSPDDYTSMTVTVSASEYTPLIRAVTGCGDECYTSGSGTLSFGAVNRNQVVLIAVTGGSGDYSISISGIVSVYKAPVIICPSNSDSN